jgi:hypothetical protein
MIRKRRYITGYKKGDVYNQSIIGFSYSTKNNTPEISLIKGQGREADGLVLAPEEALNYTPTPGFELPVDEIDQTFSGQEAARLSWFEKKCMEANCTWFVDYVKRMAAGENISLEEIQTAYRTHHNGLEMKSNSWVNFDLSDLP